MIEQLDIFGSTNSPSAYVAKTLSWIDGSWSSFWKLVELCEKEASDPNRVVCKIGKDGKSVVDHIVPVRRGDLYILAQMAGLSVTTCREFRFDNNIWAPLSRYVLMLRPKVSKVIHPIEKRDGIDLVDLCEMWRKHAWSHGRRAHVFFACEHWQDASQMVEIGDVSAV